jgi:hypothetical protein
MKPATACKDKKFCNKFSPQFLFDLFLSSEITAAAGLSESVGKTASNMQQERQQHQGQ